MKVKLSGYRSQGRLEFRPKIERLDGHLPIERLQFGKVLVGRSDAFFTCALHVVAQESPWTEQGRHGFDVCLQLLQARLCHISRDPVKAQ
jgi:hypothetical protein